MLKIQINYKKSRISFYTCSNKTIITLATNTIITICLTLALAFVFLSYVYIFFCTSNFWIMFYNKTIIDPSSNTEDEKVVKV